MLLQNLVLKAVQSVKKEKNCHHLCEQCILQICSSQNILHMTIKMYNGVGNFIFLFEQKSWLSFSSSFVQLGWIVAKNEK